MALNVQISPRTSKGNVLEVRVLGTHEVPEHLVYSTKGMLVSHRSLVPYDELRRDEHPPEVRVRPDVTDAVALEQERDVES
jgi:hypothetical protein